jgi:hypothetical protein
MHHLRTLLPLAALALVLAAPLRAQNADDFDTPPQPVPRGGGIFGAGGGVIPAWYFLNTDGLNTELSRLGYPALDKAPMFQMGGHGYVYILVIPNFRIGGMGAGGSVDVSRVVSDVLYESTSYATAFGGVTLEYVIPVGRFHLAVGGLLGGGGRSLTLTRTLNTRKDWSEVGQEAVDQHLTISNGFFSWQPWLTAEFDVNPFIVLSVTGGWYGTSGSKWTLDSHFDMNNVPDFKTDGPFLRVGLTMGLFIGE